MITLKLFGLLRIESGIKERNLEAERMQDVFQDLMAQGIPEKALSGCIILVNGAPANKRRKLKDGDVVVLMSPVAGG